MENITISELLTTWPETNKSWFSSSEETSVNVTTAAAAEKAMSSSANEVRNAAFNQQLVYLIFQKYGSLTFLGLGMIVNILIIIVMNRKTIRSSVMSTYFSTLALLDLLVVVLFLVRQWSLFFRTGRHIPSVNLASCISLKFIYHFVVTASHYVYTTVSIERFLVVAFPLKAPQLSSKKRAVFNIIGATILAILVNVNHFFMAGIVVGKKERYCHVWPKYQYFEEHFQFSLMACLQSYIPMLIIVIFNCMIAYKLAKAGRRRRQYLAGTREQNEGNHIKQYTTTALAICVVFSVLVCTTMALALNRRLNPSPLTPILGSVSNFLQAFRPSLSFFIYICTSGSIREQFLQMICRTSKPEVQRNQGRPEELVTSAPEVQCHVNLATQM